MSAKKTAKSSKHDRDGRFVVLKPSTLKDYTRLYKITNGILKKAKKLEETLCAAR